MSMEGTNYYILVIVAIVIVAVLRIAWMVYRNYRRNNPRTPQRHIQDGNMAERGVSGVRDEVRITSSDSITALPAYLDAAPQYAAEPPDYVSADTVTVTEGDAAGSIVTVSVETGSRRSHTVERI
ncbi:hypothetical protein HDU79_010908 [Rhizoclosmatium sp. JEL0117]|nr:hypothetical protein HDU79_010908 [Rhizoclosmatium sp. JEL0117]